MLVSNLSVVFKFYVYKTDQKLGPELPNALTVYTFKVTLLLPYLASLDDNLAHAFKSPFLDIEITTYLNTLSQNSAAIPIL